MEFTRNGQRYIDVKTAEELIGKKILPPIKTIRIKFVAESDIAKQLWMKEKKDREMQRRLRISRIKRMQSDKYKTVIELHLQGMSLRKIKAHLEENLGIVMSHQRVHAMIKTYFKEKRKLF